MSPALTLLLFPSRVIFFILFYFLFLESMYARHGKCGQTMVQEMSAGCIEHIPGVKDWQHRTLFKDKINENIWYTLVTNTGEQRNISAKDAVSALWDLSIERFSHTHTCNLSHSVNETVHHLQDVNTTKSDVVLAALLQSPREKVTSNEWWCLRFPCQPMRGKFYFLQESHLKYTPCH